MSVSNLHLERKFGSYQSDITSPVHPHSPRRMSRSNVGFSDACKPFTLLYAVIMAPGLEALMAIMKGNR
jgi:hypothetical protein